MKKGLVILVMLLVAGFSAQAQDTVRTLLHVKSPKTWGLYVSPEYQYGQVKNEMTHFTGGSAMLMLNNRFGFGITGSQSVDQKFSPAGISPLLVKAGFGGIKLDYVVKPASAIHISFPLMLGGGYVQADSTSYVGGGKFTGGGKGDHGGKDSLGNNGFGRSRGYSAQYGIIQPGINVEANLTKHVKFYVGANYRIALAGNTNNATAATLLPTSVAQGFSVSAGLKVGLFQNSFKLPTIKLPRFGSFRHKHSD
jgi:hypothetical protein